MVKVLHVWLSELAFLQLCLQLVFTQSSKHFAQVHFMLVSSIAINEYVVEINEYKIVNVPLHNCIHQPLERAGCVTKAQRKYRVLEQPISRYERRFLTVVRREPDLVVPTGQINGTEVLGAWQLIQ